MVLRIGSWGLGNGSSGLDLSVLELIIRTGSLGLDLRIGPSDWFMRFGKWIIGFESFGFGVDHQNQIIGIGSSDLDQRTWINGCQGHGFHFHAHGLGSTDLDRLVHERGLSASCMNGRPSAHTTIQRAFPKARETGRIGAPRMRHRPSAVRLPTGPAGMQSFGRS